MISRLIVTTALTALALIASSSARAQFGSANGNTGVSPSMNMNMAPDDRRRLTPEEALRERQIEESYDNTVRTKIPDKKKAADPWGNVRSSGAPASGSSPSAAAKPQR